MKKLLYLLAILFSAENALACEHITRLYATQTVVDFCLFITDATVGAIKVENAAHAAGDTYIMKDEGAEANTTNAFVDEGSCYSITLTATEMTAARVTLNIEDQGTKAWADACVTIDTYGDPSAQHASAATTLLATTISELASIPSASAPTVSNILRWLYQYGIGYYKKTCTSSTCTLLKDDGSTSLGTCGVSDNGTTFTRAECS